MPQPVERYQIRAIEASTGSSRVFLVDNSNQIVASAALGKTTGTVSLSEHTEDPDFDAWTSTGQVFDMETIEDSPLTSYRAFRQASIRETLIDSAYSWLMGHVLPEYDQPDLQYEDDTFVLAADGKRLGGPVAGRTGGSTAGKPRPKGKKVRIDAIWF